MTLLRTVERRRFSARERRSRKDWASLRDRVRGDPVLTERVRCKHRIKNVMGYDLRAFLDAENPIDILARLLIGSEGTLGFIASAVLDTVPLHPLLGRRSPVLPDGDRGHSRRAGAWSTTGLRRSN